MPQHVDNQKDGIRIGQLKERKTTGEHMKETHKIYITEKGSICYRKLNYFKVNLPVTHSLNLRRNEGD